MNMGNLIHDYENDNQLAYARKNACRTINERCGSMMLGDLGVDLIDAIDHIRKQKAKVKELEAENAELRAAQAWRPISELKSSPEHKLFCRVGYCPFTARAEDMYGDRTGCAVKPTHFCEIPAGPKEDIQKEKAIMLEAIGVISHHVADEHTRDEIAKQVAALKQ